MMASQPTKVHDPMYNFDTHFPERLSRLHLHGDFNASGSFKKRKNRAQRSGARYKTQPVTFDEIKEVDEEPGQATAENKETRPEQIKGQLQAFSRSMDGLLPKGATTAAEHQFQHHISHSRSGSRKFQRHPDCIPERMDLEQQQQQQQQQQQAQKPPISQQPPQLPETPQSRLQEGVKPAGTSPATPASGDVTATSSSLTPPGATGGEEKPTTPIPSPNMGVRRQKVTAKAKKRQKAAEDGDIL